MRGDSYGKRAGERDSPVTGCGQAAAAESGPASTAKGKSSKRRGPGLRYERVWIARGHVLVAGIDEAGRGPWAGPVVAAAVVLGAGRSPKGIDDSKKVSPAGRERLYDELMARAEVGIGIADVARIDRDNILRASLWAMAQALSKLPRQPHAALVDGMSAPDLPCPVETIVEGDARSLSIAAASIIAKVTRDRMMVALARLHPGYGWEHNMGYGVPEHRDGIARLGLTLHHRRSFRPVALVAKEAGEGMPGPRAGP